MCLDIREGSLPNILAEDTTVLKIGTCHDDKFTPVYHRDFHYKIGVKTEVVDLEPIAYRESSGQYIKKGYHAYIDIDPFNRYYFKRLGKSRGLDHVIGIFTYPKGTIIYQDDHNEIVGNQIIFTGKYKHL